MKEVGTRRFGRENGVSEKICIGNQSIQLDCQKGSGDEVESHKRQAS